MCLIFLSYQQHPEYPLIVLANRDEFYRRPTEQASYWSNDDVLAGKDIEGGGTWLGLNQNGKLAMLTNYRDLKNIKANAPTRGKLVSNFLQGDFNPEQYLMALDQSAPLYNGYNIILGTVHDPWYYSNYQRKIYRLGSGLYGLSNELLDSPWPKVVNGKASVNAALQSSKIDREALFDLMRNAHQANDDELPDTGIGLSKERALSPMFISTPDYGTRCTTLIMMNTSGEVTFEERTYVPDNTQVAYQFTL